MCFYPNINTNVIVGLQQNKNVDALVPMESPYATSY